MPKIQSPDLPNYLVDLSETEKLESLWDNDCIKQNLGLFLSHDSPDSFLSHDSPDSLYQKLPYDPEYIGTFPLSFSTFCLLCLLTFTSFLQSNIIHFYVVPHCIPRHIPLSSPKWEIKNLN